MGLTREEVMSYCVNRWIMPWQQRRKKLPEGLMTTLPLLPLFPKKYFKSIWEMRKKPVFCPCRYWQWAGSCPAVGSSGRSCWSVCDQIWGCSRNKAGTLPALKNWHSSLSFVLQYFWKSLDIYKAYIKIRRLTRWVCFWPLPVCFFL